MKSLLSATFYSAFLAMLVGTSIPIQAAEPPLVIEKGDARAERVTRFGGILRGAPPSLMLKGQSPITSEEALEALWKEWKLGEVPDVDFATQVVTVATWGGSRIDMLRSIDDEGNLFVGGGGGTKDKIDGFSYVIEIYSLTGIRTVNGRKWPAHRQKQPEEKSDSAKSRSYRDSKGGRGRREDAGSGPQAWRSTARPTNIA